MTRFKIQKNIQLESNKFVIKRIEFSYNITMRNLCYINLSALRKNAENVKKLLPKGVKLNAVVKADGYGHGAERVAQELYSIVDSYSVSIIEEAISLRNSGIDKEILLLIPLQEDEIEKAIEYNITISCEDIRLLKSINDVAINVKKNAKVHVKYDTGMNRLGIKTIEELIEFLEYSKKLKGVMIEGIFSHYAQPENKKSVKKATDKFLLAIEVVKRYNVNAVCHISASGGFLRENYFDMVRIGLLLYGYKPYKCSKISVTPIMKVYSFVVCRKKLKKGESALYGKCRTEKNCEITLVRYGYADGLSRKKNHLTFNNRCMDITAVKGRVGEKKYVVMNNANSLAKTYGTISYEILVHSTKRAEKIYIN